MLVNQLEIINACAEMTWQCERSSYPNYNIVVVVASYHALLFELLLADIDHNCMRTGFEVCACIASSPHVRKKNLFHKLIHEKKFRGSVPSTKYFLTLNYFQNTVYAKVTD